MRSAVTISRKEIEHNGSKRGMQNKRIGFLSGESILSVGDAASLSILTTVEAVEKVSHQQTVVIVEAFAVAQ